MGCGVELKGKERSGKVYRMSQLDLMIFIVQVNFKDQENLGIAHDIVIYCVSSKDVRSPIQC